MERRFIFVKTRRSLIMREKLINSLISACVGGVVAFCVALSVSNSGADSAHGNLAVKSLEVAETIKIKSPENDEDVIILRNDGLIFSKNKIVTEHYLGKQFSGHLLVGNRVLVSPNDLVNSPTDSLEFLGELGINRVTGSGELIVRSPNGGNAVGKGAVDGQFAQIGFDQNDMLQFLVYDNAKKSAHFVANQDPASGQLDVDYFSEPTLERSQAGLPIAGPQVQPVPTNDTDISEDLADETDEEALFNHDFMQ